MIWQWFVLITLLALPTFAVGEEPIDQNSCSELIHPSDSQDFQFEPSSAHEALAQSLPEQTVIGDIRIRRFSVFDLDDPKEDKWLYQQANRWHSLTRENVIREQLLISSDEKYDVTRLRETERILRELRFIYDATARPWRVCGDVVDIEIITRDVWTLTPTLSFSRSGGENEYAIGVRDTNVLGTGKHVVLRAKDDGERSGLTFFYKDPAVFGSRWRARIGLTDNDDGFDRNLTVVRPFYSIFEQWSAGLFLQENKLEENIWFRGEEVAEFDHAKEVYQVFGGVAPATHQGNGIGRWRFGYRYESNEFSFSESDLPPDELPADRDYSYPFFGYQSIEDDYRKVRNINFLGRTEDLYVGETYQWNVGWSGQGLGASRDQLAIEASYSSSLLTSNDHLWLIDTSISGFWNADQDTSTNIDTDTEEFENLWWTAATRYHYRQSDQWALFARLRLDYTDGLTDDRQLTLGGSNGLRGYEQNYQTGDRSFVVNLEQRYYSDWHPFRLIRVGAAAFLDVGRAWFNDTDNGSNGDVLANVGVGLRINSSRSQRGNVLHIDLAFPLSKDDDVDSVQILVTVKETF
jgi:hypothetical protein